MRADVACDAETRHEDASAPQRPRPSLVSVACAVLCDVAGTRGSDVDLHNGGNHIAQSRV